MKRDNIEKRERMRGIERKGEKKREKTSLPCFGFEFDLRNPKRQVFLLPLLLDCQ